MSLAGETTDAFHAARDAPRASPLHGVMEGATSTLVLTLSYDGAPFAGFARQSGHDTVQGRLERALETLLRETVTSTGAGRTDAGVHARQQVVSVPLRGDHPKPERLLAGLNAIIGDGIAITSVRIAPAGFSARFDAVSREYRYHVVCGRVPPLFLRRLSWWVKSDLDLRAMRKAATLLVGEHDFRSFCVARSAGERSTVRRIDRIDIDVVEHFGERCVCVRVRGNAFLHSMIRVLVGTLVEVGRGSRDPLWAGEVLTAKRRAAAGPTAPACGLILWEVEYESDVLRTAEQASAGSTLCSCEP